MDIVFHQLSTERGCQSYLVGCKESCSAIIIDPETSMMERYQGLANHEGLKIHYLLDTHTHADHFSASQALGAKLGVPVIMHRNSPAPFVDMQIDDGEIVVVGNLKLNIMHTPGHTSDSICIQLDDRIFTGDTLLINGTGRTDLPTGDPDKLYDSLFNRLLTLEPRLKVFPAHIYGDRQYSTLGEEAENNPRLQKKKRSEFVEQMRALDLKMPTHLTEAIRTNLSGGKTVEELIASAADRVSFMSLEEVKRRLESTSPDILLLDVREHTAFAESHIPGAIHIPRGQLELCVNEMLPDPTKRIVVYCEYGKISTLATATLKDMGFLRAVALDTGMKMWNEKGYPVENN